MGHKTTKTKHYRSGRQQVSTVKVSWKKHNKHDCKLQDRIIMLVCLKLWLLKVAKYASQTNRYSAVLLTKALTVLLIPLAKQSKETKSASDTQPGTRAFNGDTYITSGKQTLARGCALASSENSGYQAVSGTLNDTGERGKNTSISSCSTSSNIQKIQECKCEKESCDVIKNFDNKDTARTDLQPDLQRVESNTANCYTFNLKTSRYEAEMLPDSMNGNTRLIDSAPTEVEFELRKLLLKSIRSSTEARIDHNSTYIAYPVYKRDSSYQPTHETRNSFRFEPLTTIVNRIADGERVPPQTTMKYEMLRFCTLRSYPKENKPYITRLAQAGFYYAKSGDEVVCYCCARRKRNWRENDNPMDVHREMNPNCSFLTNNSEVNVPIRSQPQQDPGTSQRQQTNDPNNISSDEHRGNSSEANMSNNLEFARARTNPCVGAATINEGVAIQTHSYRSDRQAGENWPSTNPKYPKYSSKAIRLTSFGDCVDIVVTPERLAEAGFFYAGFGDCVRCFQCGVGLRHWSAEDDPWIEHSRWSKECSFVRQIRGAEFVNLVQMAVQYSQNQTVQDEAPARGLSSANSEAATSSGNQTDLDTILLNDAAQSVLEMGYSPSIVKKAVRKITAKNSSANINAASLMEQIFEIEEADNPETSASRDTETRHTQIQSTQSQDTQETNQGRSQNTTNERAEISRNKQCTSMCRNKTDDLGDYTRENVEQEASAYESHQNSAQSNSSFSTPKRQDLAAGDTAHTHSTQLQEQKRLKEENEKLKGQTICKTCKKKEVCIVFLPCGHLVTCADCAPTVRYCTESTCGRYIKGTVRTYLA